MQGERRGNAELMQGNTGERSDNAEVSYLSKLPQ